MANSGFPARGVGACVIFSSHVSDGLYGAPLLLVARPASATCPAIRYDSVTAFGSWYTVSAMDLTGEGVPALEHRSCTTGCHASAASKSGYSIFVSRPRDRADSNILWKNSMARIIYAVSKARPHWRSDIENPCPAITCRIPSKE